MPDTRHSKFTPTLDTQLHKNVIQERALDLIENLFKKIFFLADNAICLIMLIVVVFLLHSFPHVLTHGSLTCSHIKYQYCDVPGSPCLSKNGSNVRSVLFLNFCRQLLLSQLWIPGQLSCRCLEPGSFIGDPTLLARDNIYL